MAAICCVHVPLSSSLPSKRIRGFHCSARSQDKKETPRLLKIAVSGITEILRIFSFENQNRRYSEKGLDTVYTQIEDPLDCGVDDVVTILQSDYENAYFLTGRCNATGNFTASIYADDCSFEDPTIKFSGKDLYSRNLKLLVPFFDSPSLMLQQIEKVLSSETNFVRAKWKLRTYLKLPWRPVISIEGSTVYDLDDEFKIVRHAESWNVSALEAVGQIFTPSRSSNE